MLFNESNEEYVMRKETIITDRDCIIQYIDYEWCRAFKELYDEVYYKFFDYKHLENLSVESLNQRDEYYFSKWLLKEDKENLTPEEYALFEMPYTDDTFFYNRCPMLKMYNVLINLSKQNFVSKIIILTQTQFGYEGDPRKEFIFDNFIKPYSDKFELIQIPLDKPKWEYIKENNLFFTLFIDDRSDIIKDVAEKCDMHRKQFMIPKLGYNYDLRSDTDFLTILEMHGSQLLQYDQQIIPFVPNMYIGE